MQILDKKVYKTLLKDTKRCEKNEEICHVNKS